MDFQGGRPQKNFQTLVTGSTVSVTTKPRPTICFFKEIKIEIEFIFLKIICWPGCYHNKLILLTPVKIKNSSA